jgi:DNA adenine methylase
MKSASVQKDLKGDVVESSQSNQAKPFLKWAGGKRQLLGDITNSLPPGIRENDFVYVEPFVGSGAVLFWFLNNFTNISKAIINDVNTDLINCYISVKVNVNQLIARLKSLEEQYFSYPLESDRKLFFLEKRAEYNLRKADDLGQSALLIFLNKTCYNGLYRVNSKNEFNVPFGKYKNPKICDMPNLKAVNAALEKVSILNTDFSATLEHVQNANSFFYFDPPYKPISKSASFNTYSKRGFGDDEQVRLKEFCDKLNNRDINWLLSNSDVKNIDPDDNYFDDLYANYSIERVRANRAINSNAGKRGKISELLIRNY